MKKQLMTLVLAVGLAGTVSAIPVFGQAQGGAAGGGGGGGGAANGNNGNNGGGNRGRRNFDPAQFRQRMQDQMKTEMGATDDEWKVLQPKIDKVQALQMASRGGFGGFRGRGRGNQADGAQEAPPAPPADASTVVKAAYDLRVTLLKKDATPEDIKAKLTALRDAKTKAKEELTKAQNDLRDVASVRQEAVLVQDGLLE